MRTVFFWVRTQQVVVISYRCFETTYWSHLKGSRTQKGLNSRPLKMGSIGCSDTSVRNYHYLLRNSLEDRGSHLLVFGLRYELSASLCVVCLTRRHPTGCRCNLNTSYLRLCDISDRNKFISNQTNNVWFRSCMFRLS